MRSVATAPAPLLLLAPLRAADTESKTEIFPVADLCPADAPERAADLAEALRAQFAPAPAPLLEIAAKGTITAKGDAEQLRRTAAFLAFQRASAKRVVRIQARLILLEPPTRERLVKGAGPLLIKGAMEEKAFFAALDEAGGYALFGPRELRVPNLRPAADAFAKPFTYVAAYEERGVDAPRAERRVLPVLKEIGEGLLFDGLPVLLEGDRVWCRFRIVARTVVRPVPAEATPHGDIALPEVASKETAASAVVPVGSTVLFPGPGFEPLCSLVALELTLE